MDVTVPDHLFGQLPFFDVVDTDATVIVDMHNRSDLTNIRGALQGGLVATLIDVAAGRLAIKHAGEGNGTSTADMSIHFLEPIVTGPARATATLVRVGKRTIVVAVDVLDMGRDRLAARSTLSFAVLRAEPSGEPRTHVSDRS